jgi:hypothetical protein
MVHFFWHVAVSGYRWRDHDENGYAQADLQPIGWPNARQYEPLREFTGLFRTFAETEPTREGILGFANRFGPLGLCIIPPSMIHQTVDIFDPQVQDEPLEGWEDQLRSMKLAVWWWDLLQQGALDRLPEADRRGVPETINVGLRKWVSPQFRPDPDKGGMSLEIVPQNLVGALWLQFAQAVSRQRRHRKCGTCGMWFEVSPGVARSNRLYCSEACRSKAYRDRKDRAQQLHAQGRPIKEIAEELNSTVKVVKGWISQRKG